ncbi:arfaptin-1 isoform X2 [Catharus ustulatus]|uniref:ADP ribosylation factor interacting protein 1 n=1 Tax=Catharus ustulatus TaxID=91951 RepID=A0A8C3TV69_CATUS|nr:arfaptin-1 isoform X2 [Catharus ustulatus]
MPYLAATSAFFLPLSTALMMSIFSSIDMLFFILTGGSGRASAMAPSSVSQARPSAPTARQAPSLPLRLLSQPAAGSHGHGTWRSWSNLPGGAGGGCHGCDHRHDGLEGPPPSSSFRPGASGSYCYRRRKKIKLERVAGDAPPDLLRPRFPPYVLPSRLLQHDAPGAAAAPPAGMSEHSSESTTLDESHPSAEEVQSGSEESAMAQESPKNSAAEIPVTSNGQLEDSHEYNFNRNLKCSLPVGLGLSETKITSHGFDGAKEGVVEAGQFPRKGGRAQQKSGPVVLADEVKNPAMEKLELVRKWSLNTYKCTRQIISEKLGRGSRTVDLELEAQIDRLKDNKKKYENILRLAQTLSTQLFQMVHTQRQLGDAFADLSLKSLELHEEFGYNADTQKLLAKNGETLLGAINFFIASVNTLVNKTIEDTLLTVKQYESARVEYDAYRTDLEELNLGPRDANTLPKIEQSQQLFQVHKEKYDKMRNDVSIKLKFLEENKVKVLHNQLVLFHNAIAAYFAGNQKQLEQTLKQFHIKLKTPGADAPSWLEEQ